MSTRDDAYAAANLSVRAGTDEYVRRYTDAPFVDASQVRAVGNESLLDVVRRVLAPFGYGAADIKCYVSANKVPKP